MIKVEFSASYSADLRELLAGSPDLKEKIETRVNVFHSNPEDTKLANHPLKKKLQGKWAFSITSDVRIVYKIVGKNIVLFLAIGGHDKVYKRLHP